MKALTQVPIILLIFLAGCAVIPTRTPVPTPAEIRESATPTPSLMNTKEFTSPLSPTVTAGTPSETPADELKSSIINSLEIDWVSAFAWAPDSTSFVISGEFKGKYGIGLYPVNSNQPKWFIETGLIFALTYTPDGESIVFSPSDNRLEFVDVDSGRLINELIVEPCAEEYYDSMVFSGKILFAGDWYEVKHPNVFSSDVDLWDIENGTCKANYITTQGFLRYMELNRDGYLALNIHRIGEARNYEVQIWDINSTEQVCIIKDRYFSALNPAKAEIVVFTEGEIAEVWDIQSCKEIKEIRKINKSALIAISPDGNTLAVAGQELILIDLRTDTTLFTIPNLPNLPNYPLIVKYNQDGNLFAAVIPKHDTEFDAVIIWDLKNVLDFNP